MEDEGGGGGGGVEEGTMEDSASAAAAAEGFVNLEIHPTTGGQFQLRLHRTDGVEQLKKLISRKLALAKDRICLLHRDRDLREGSLEENEVKNGAKITLLPIVETGLISQKPESSVLQALENLSDAQVNTFLEGKAPLNLSMRLGEHMMFIQLQLSTVNGQQQRGGEASRSSHSRVRGTGAGTGGGCAKPRCPPPTNTTTTTASSSSSSQLVRTFAEASRSLSNTLHNLSSQAASCATAAASTAAAQEGDKRRPGAIIESMQAHGRGVYSGTFSGTLNPALQDRNGNPKRDISTIVHILNDLLGASPHYRRSRAARTTSTAAALAPPAAVPHEALSLENLTTRGKMEQLQQMLMERRNRRRERREARATPYAPPTSAPASRHPAPVFLLAPSQPPRLSSSPPSSSSMDTSASSGGGSSPAAPPAAEERKLQAEGVVI